MDPTRMPAAHDENQDEETESRRWWSRLRPAPAPRPQPDGGAPRPDKGDIIREGELVRLRRHTLQNRPAFQRWYADHDIARLLRHDLRPLTPVQSLVYFDTVILPSSARGLSCASGAASGSRWMPKRWVMLVPLPGDRITSGSCGY